MPHASHSRVRYLKKDFVAAVAVSGISIHFVSGDAEALARRRGDAHEWLVCTNLPLRIVRLHRLATMQR
jgi:hypothetical protein